MRRSIVTLLGAMVVLCSCQQARLKRVRVAPEPVSVKVDTLAMVRNVPRVSYVGTVELSREITLTASHGGDLVQLNARQGQKVRAGQALGVVRSQAVQSSYDAAMAALAQAEDGYQRAKKVFDNGSIPQVKMVEITTRLSQARASAQAAAQALEECTVRAPYAGEISDVIVRKGEHVTVSQPILTMVSGEAVEVSFSVPENEAYSIRPGLSARILFPAQGLELPAVVKTRAVTGNTLSHSYRCTLALKECPSQLLPGMICKVLLDKDTIQGIAVPSDAVKLDDDGKYVWTVDGEGTVAKRRITTGAYIGKGVIATSGLTEGDLLIVEGTSKVSTGMKVKIVQ